jgi:diguanylate cyclase (GGDEF)-like protein
MSTLPISASNRALPALVGGVVALSLAVLTAVLLYYVDAKARLEADVQARAVLGEARELIDRRLETALAVPETLAVVIAAGERIDMRTFNAIAARLIRANPSIRNVALAPDGVITAIYPVAGNEAALGLRYADVPEQNEAVLRAMRTRRTVIAGPIPLVQGGTGLLSRTPVFLRDDEGNDSRYWGIVSLAVDTGQLFVDIEQIARRSELMVAVRRADAGQLAGEAFSGPPGVFASAPVSTYYPLPGGGRWQLGAVPRGGWVSVTGVPLAARALLYVLCAVLGWTAYRVVASRNRHQALAHRDALTGLANRKSFDHRLKAMLPAKPCSCALVLIDLDAFKPVNDTHGHSAGDEALRQVAKRLRQLIRGTDVVYRLGGDEFAILLEDVRSGHDMLRLADRAIERIGQPIALDGDGCVATIGASAGLALFPLGGKPDRAAEVFDRADRALYRCKAQGGNCAHAEPPLDARDAPA